MNLYEAQQQILLQVNETYEIRKEALQRTTLIQEQRTKWHDKYLKKKNFQLGPYEIDTVYDNGSIKIKTIDEHQTPLLVNGHG
jgi:hypothetical protein